MIISDLDYLENASQTVKIVGSRSKKLGKLGINIGTQIAVPIALGFNILSKGSVTAITGTIQDISFD